MELLLSQSSAMTAILRTGMGVGTIARLNQDGSATICKGSDPAVAALAHMDQHGQCLQVAAVPAKGLKDASSVQLGRTRTSLGAGTLDAFPVRQVLSQMLVKTNAVQSLPAHLESREPEQVRPLGYHRPALHALLASTSPHVVSGTLLVFPCSPVVLANAGLAILPPALALASFANLTHTKNLMARGFLSAKNAQSDPRQQLAALQ